MKSVSTEPDNDMHVYLSDKVFVTNFHKTWALGCKAKKVQKAVKWELTNHCIYAKSDWMPPWFHDNLSLHQHRHTSTKMSINHITTNKNQSYTKLTHSLWYCHYSVKLISNAPSAVYSMIRLIHIRSPQFQVSELEPLSLLYIW